MDAVTITSCDVMLQQEMQVQVCPEMGVLRVQQGEQEGQVRQQMEMNNISREELEVLVEKMAEQVLQTADIVAEQVPEVQVQEHVVVQAEQVEQAHHVLQVVLLEALIAEMQLPANPVWLEDPAQQEM